MMSETLTGINIAKKDIANMTVETIYVAADAVSYILNLIKLSEDEQIEAVDELVDRNKDWLELDDEKQSEKIEICLVQATVVKYLTYSDTIRNDCTGINVGIRADDGAVVVEAMYVHMNREERRMWSKGGKRKRRKHTDGDIIKVERSESKDE
jgi:hypothetical protein